ncbi:MAG: M48 family metalloprotease [Gammaproteobacteria bacterium]|nr:M48 family metalloprotease [Gammaproteobacteria bacterium]MCW8988855.1 M48 family metalloprotease [Gammaproteobacteria bacterium]
MSIVSYADNINLPDIGDNAGNISLAEEYRTGEAVIRNIRRAGGVLDDPIIQGYLNELGYRLVSHSETQQLFHFFLIKDTSINAFALPGGFIGINAGLILATKSESELAGVMAHEIAHITQRHHARQYEQGSNSIPIIAALIAAMVLGSQNNDIGQAALASVAAGSAQQQINFTRSNEKEADRIGINLLINAEFNPHGMADFFDTMDKQSRLYGDSIPEFLRSHPVNPARIADAKHRASTYKNGLESSSTTYHLLRSRLKVLASDDTAELLKDFSSKLSDGNYQNKEATRYGYALALQTNKQYSQALKQIDILIDKNPEQITYNILKAQIETDAQLYPAAIKTFKKLLNLYPGNNTVNLYYAETLLKANKIELADKILQAQISPSTKIPKLYQLLANTQAKLNKPASSHQSLAEYYYLLGQTHDAIKQLELGLKIANVDFYLTSRLEARLKEFKAELHELSSK